MKKIKIFVSYHQEALRVENEIFQPIQIGRDVFPYVLDGMIGDNTGENISYKQPLYSDLVTSYWILHNKIEEYDYIGVCHYRRIFSFKKPLTWRNIKEKIKCNIAVYLMGTYIPGGNLMDWNAHFVYNEDEYIQFIEQFTDDIKRDISGNRHQIYGLYPAKQSGTKYGLLFDQHIGHASIILFEEILKKQYPEFYEVFIENYNSTISYYGNLFIMRKDRFKEYTLMLFELLAEHERLCVESGLFIDPLKEKSFARGEGFLAEMMTSTFIRYYLKKDKKIVKLLHGVLYNVI